MICALASLPTTLLPLGAWILSPNPEQLALNLVGFYPAMQPTTQSHTVLGHLSVIELLKDWSCLTGLSPLSCQKPDWEHLTSELTWRSVVSSILSLNTMHSTELSPLQGWEPSPMSHMQQGPNKYFPTKI